MERTLVFHRATLPDDTVLLPPRHPVSGADGLLTVTALTRNAEGSITGQHIASFDPWRIASYEFGRGQRSGQGNYRHKTLTVTYDDDSTETVEIPREGEITLNGIQVNEDGHRTQPFTYRVATQTLERISLDVYELKALPRLAYVGNLVGRQPSADGSGWIPVYDNIVVNERTV